jgi:hypothetical protein
MFWKGDVPMRELQQRVFWPRDVPQVMESVIDPTNTFSIVNHSNVNQSP